MAVKIERAVRNSLDDYCRVEAASAIGMAYVRDVFEYFTEYSVGDLSCGYIDGTLAGIGKLSRLFDGSAWLETLRVDKQYQGRGVGKAFYRHFREEAKALGCPVMRMYTGLKNEVSAGLARVNGFETVATHQGMYLELAGVEDGAMPEGFRPATPREAMAVWAGREKGFICLNRTFYEHNPDTLAGFGAEGKVFVHPETGSALILGARFQREKGLHMAVPVGDIDLCIRFASAYTVAQGLPRLTCTFGVDDKVVEARLTAAAFAPEPYATIVMEGRV